MKSKLPMVIIFSLLTFFSLGCIDDISPSPGEITMGPENPQVTFSVTTDNSKATFTLDGKETEIRPNEEGRASLTVHYENLTQGDHHLTVQDSDSSPREWTIHVVKKQISDSGANIAKSWKEVYSEWERRAEEQLSH